MKPGKLIICAQGLLAASDRTAVVLDDFDYSTAARNDTCPEAKNARNGSKLEVTVIPSKFLDWTLADIAVILATARCCGRRGWRAQGIKFVPMKSRKNGVANPSRNRPLPGSLNRTLPARPQPDRSCQAV